MKLKKCGTIVKKLLKFGVFNQNWTLTLRLLMWSWIWKLNKIKLWDYNYGMWDTSLLQIFVHFEFVNENNKKTFKIWQQCKHTENFTLGVTKVHKCVNFP